MRPIDADKLLESINPIRVTVGEHHIDMVAYSSLERTINSMAEPKLPLNIQGDPPFGYCPSCNHVVLKHMDVNGCRQCLQRLKWG